MKRIFIVILLVLCMVCILFPAKSQVMAATSGQFKYSTLSDGTLRITGHTAPTGALTIPSQIDGKTVTEIGSYAFYYETGITSVVIPNTVKTIGAYAFHYCFGIKSITFGTGIKEIGSSAFYYNKISGNLVLPDSVEKIGSEAFCSISGITSVTFGKNLKEFDASAFSADVGLTTYNVNASNPNFSAQNGVLFNKDKTEIVAYPTAKTGTTYAIPSTVKVIGKYAFYWNKSLTSITIPNTVTDIQRGAFAEDVNLSTVTLRK